MVSSDSPTEHRRIGPNLPNLITAVELPPMQPIAETEFPVSDGVRTHPDPGAPQKIQRRLAARIVPVQSDIAGPQPGGNGAEGAGTVSREKVWISFHDVASLALPDRAAPDYATEAASPAPGAPPPLPDRPPAFDYTHCAGALGRAAWVAHQMQTLADTRDDEYARLHAEYQRLVAGLRRYYAIHVERAFGSIRALLVDIPYDLIKGLGDQSLVRYIELNQAGEPPPGPTASGASSIHDQIGSESYRDLDGGRIALLDGGVDFSLLPLPEANPAGARLLENVQRRFNCLISDPQGPCAEMARDQPDGCGIHATLVAAVLTGSTTDPAYRGICSVPVDSYRLYANVDGDCGLNVEAALAAFDYVLQQKGVYTVVAALIQGDRDDASVLVKKAEEVFAAGISVIAPTGNFSDDPGRQLEGDSREIVLVPALARTVLAVGAVDENDITRPHALQRAGRVEERIKPDVQARTTYPAIDRNWMPGDAGVELSGTSGATPFVAGAAALLHNWLQLNHPELAEPGMVYALLILSGQQGRVDSSNGAGLLKLPGPRPPVLGKITLQAGYEQIINLKIDTTVEGIFDAAIWWPKAGDDLYRQIYLELLPPADNPEVEPSCDDYSVFQRVRFAGPITAGTWRLRIRWCVHPQNPPLFQDVYWTTCLQS